MWKSTLSLLLIFVLSGCQKSPSKDASQRGTATLQKITVAYTYQPQSTLAHVAVAKGYFAEEGLEVQSLMHTFGKASLQSLIDHKADFAAVAETPFMFNVLKGEKIFVIANIEASGKNNAIVARKDVGISVVGDLKGKRIGFTPGTTSDFFLDSMLTVIGLTRQSIQPVPLKPEEMLAAIVEKSVDAVCTWNYPLTQIKRQLGSNGVLFYDPIIYTETFNFAAQQDFVQKNPETVKRFLRALIKAENFVAQHPDEAQAIMSAATKTDLDLIREVWSAFNYRVVLDKKLLITLEDETRWAMKNKLTDQTVMPEYQNYIHLDSLRAVKPDAIRGGR
jgi:ABC-type nitrate/sulfonate/bicarbonate transport system substrate-binding protein